MKSGSGRNGVGGTVHRSSKAGVTRLTAWTQVALVTAHDWLSGETCFYAHVYVHAHKFITDFTEIKGVKHNL